MSLFIRDLEVWRLGELSKKFARINQAAYLINSACGGSG